MLQRAVTRRRPCTHASSVASVAKTPYKFAMGPGALTNRTLQPVRMDPAPTTRQLEGLLLVEGRGLGLFGGSFLRLGFRCCIEAFSAPVSASARVASNGAGGR